MNWLHFCILSVAYAKIFANCDDGPKSAPLKNELSFTFDLSNQNPSDKYGLTHRYNSGVTASRLKPSEGNRLTKIVDGHETVVSFSPDQVVTEVLYTPRDKPKLLAVRYTKNNVLVTKKYRKLFVWNEVTLSDYNYLFSKLTQLPLEATLDVSNLNESKFNVSDDTYGQLKIKNITTTKGYQANRVVDGNDLLWESEWDENFSFGFVTVDSSPKLLSFTVLKKNRYEVKYFTSFDDKFHEVTSSEFNFVLNNFTLKTQNDLVLDLDNLDTSKCEVSFFSSEGVDFVNVHPNDDVTVKNVMVGEFPLWSSSEFSKCLNVSFTTRSNPRLYNLLLADTNNGETRDYSVHFMKENDQFLGLPEDEYSLKLKSFSMYYFPVKDSTYDLKELMQKVAEDEHVTYFYSSGAKKVDRVTYGSDLVWVSTNGERLNTLYLFKSKEKYLLQFSLFNKNNRTSTKYFQHSFSYFDVDRKSVKEKNEKFFDGWLWLSTPEFFKNVPHSLLVKTYYSLDASNDADLGEFEFKKGVFGNVAVKTYVPYPSFVVTSLFDGNDHLWSSSGGESLLGVSFYGSFRDVYNNSEKVASITDYKMAELYVKNGVNVTRKHLVFKVSGMNRTWESVCSSKFDDLYKKL